VARSKRFVPRADETQGNRAAFGKLGDEAASVCQRVEDNAFHLRALSERWIGFSEDDAKTDRRMRKIFCDQHYCLKKVKKSWSSVPRFDSIKPGELHTKKYQKC
jgi:hypothetical protein